MSDYDSIEGMWQSLEEGMRSKGTSESVIAARKTVFGLGALAMSTAQRNIVAKNLDAGVSIAENAKAVRALHESVEKFTDAALAGMN